MSVYSNNGIRLRLVRWTVVSVITFQNTTFYSVRDKSIVK
jgi:hypothetical protein